MIRVGRPPFAFRIQGPDDWMLLETAPSTWKRSLERLLADKAAEPFGDGRTHSAQAFLPVPGTSWTALVTGTVGRADHADLLDLLVGRMVGSLRVQRQPPGHRLQ
jgi:hypothetical protein